MQLVMRGQRLEWPRRPLVMGIVNLVGDSFSGDGIVTISDAVAHARSLVAAGADIIDIGAESARTNRPPISEEAEIAQLRQFIEQWDDSTPLSINTWRPGVARAALAAGGAILNDISGLPDATNAAICAEAGAALVIMHSIGQPKVPHTHITYRDLKGEMIGFFREKISLAQTAGLSRDALILDPGIDFAKQREDNLWILRELHEFRQFGRPLLLAASRKTVIGQVLDIADPAERDAGTIACLVQGVLCGSAILRVHNVRAAAQTVRTIGALLE